ncbi:dispersin Aap [Escherichia coli]|uniref:dispersin Aap n=1 Tax=Escherichia coli TaxID=562 RepID=UPI0017910114|nr:dispersin Aap [Escherichia coli]EFD5161500.1 hypothetical protein [Escherichia coli]EKY3545524.1 hypothetical protein [Escherichia coli]MDO2557473.1 dispersin Aap [Escherichia coli]MDO2658777.1 dispersin Aap [Escherichia coli]HCN0412303.1 hypothetical protein [Escherichia coli]
MNKIKFVIFSGILGFSLNAFAGGSGWIADNVDPSQCIKLSGVQYTYNSSASVCMQGLNEGKVRGVSVSGEFYYNDGTTSNFKGVVTPSKLVNTNQDMNKTKKVGVQKYRVLTEWVK